MGRVKVVSRGTCVVHTLYWQPGHGWSEKAGLDYMLNEWNVIWHTSRGGENGPHGRYQDMWPQFHESIKNKVKNICLIMQVRSMNKKGKPQKITFYLNVIKMLTHMCKWHWANRQTGCLEIPLSAISGTSNQLGGPTSKIPDGQLDSQCSIV